MITVVGGTYDELCFEPYWKQRYGSGLRGCWALNAFSNTTVDFYTFCDSGAVEYLKLLSFIKAHPTIIDKTVEFFYDHPLISPRISPRPDTIDKSKHTLTVSADNVLCYGFLEGSATIKANKVVYDPQSPVMPLSFSAMNSEANEVVYVINWNEARLLSGKQTIEEIKTYFFEVENASVLVLKMGPRGAFVFTSEGDEKIIPVYKTESVWPIGSGDVFAAIFAAKWFENGDPFAAAAEASWQTACYCNTKDFKFSAINGISGIVPLTVKDFPKRQVYLAGPFFTFAERWLIDQVRNGIQDIGLHVFSPFHDIGHGVASEVVPKDLNALENSAIVFAILDGLDSGTLFEVGYAVKKGIPVVGYVENESLESVKMLEGTSCILEKDLTTAIYKCFWKLAENE